MPKYTGQQIDLIESLAQTLEHFAPARSHAGEDGHGYFRKFRNYMLEYGEIHDGIEMDLSNVINYHSRVVRTGSGVRMKAPAFDGPLTKNLPKGIKFSGEALRNIMKDRRLLEREPMLNAYLKFANMQFDRAETDNWDAYGYLSDPAFAIAQAFFSGIEHLPTAAELQQLQARDPKAYQAAMKIMKFMDAFADLHGAELLTDPKKADPAETGAKEAERLRRLEKLQTATQALVDTPKEDVDSFMRETGNTDEYSKLERTVYGGADYEENAPIRQLPSYAEKLKRLLQQGLSLEEARLLHDYHTVFTTVRKDQSGAGFKYEDMNEPYRSQLLVVDRLCRACGDKFENGFPSVQEKNEFFKSLGTASEQLAHTLKTIVPSSKIYESGTEEANLKIQRTGDVYKTIYGEAVVENGLLNRASNMKQRIIGLEQTEQWLNRTELNPAYNMLKGSGTSGLGQKNGSEEQNYKAMMSSLNSVTRQFGKRKLNGTERMALGENCRTAAQKAEAWLGDALTKLQGAALPQNERRLTERRVIGTLGVVRTLNPEKAEVLRQKAAEALGRNLSWDEIRTAAAADRDRNPNFNRYYELHSGEAVEALPAQRLEEYAAKAASALYYQDKPNQKFDLSVPRSLAEKLQKNADFKAAMRAAGPEVVRQTLRSRNVEELSRLINGTPRRYAVNDQAKRKLKALSDRMQTEGRSKEWGALKTALADGNMKSSRDVFHAVEAYVKGKKAVTGNAQRKESVKLALDALAIVAENGDDVAKARAQILVDRFNEVRHAAPGQRNYVDIRNYGQAPEPEAAAAEGHEAAPQQELQV